MLWLLLACTPVLDAPTRLDAPEGWAPLEAHDDAWVGHRPSEVACPVSTWGPEGAGWEVQTGACNYASFGQPLTLELPAGTLVEGWLWHEALDAPEPAEAHFAVALGDRVLFETWVVIPGDANVVSFEDALPETVPAGELLQVHLHNHGFNSWTVGRIEAVPVR